MKYADLNKRIYFFARQAALSGWGLSVLIIWAFFEPSVWFIIPDFLLLLFVVLYPSDYKRYFYITITASALGMFAHAAFIYSNPRIAYELLLSTTFVSVEMLGTVKQFFIEYGESAALIQPFSGIPGKVWTFVVFQEKLNMWGYLLIVTVSRAIRIFAVAFVVAKLAKLLKSLPRNHFLSFLIFYLFVFGFVLYLLYF